MPDLNDVKRFEMRPAPRGPVFPDSSRDRLMFNLSSKVAKVSTSNGRPRDGKCTGTCAAETGSDSSAAAAAARKTLRLKMEDLPRSAVLLR